MAEWIDMLLEQPKPNKGVFATDGHGIIFAQYGGSIGEMDIHGWWTLAFLTGKPINSSHITHWQHVPNLPQPPTIRPIAYKCKYLENVITQTGLPYIHEYRYRVEYDETMPGFILTNGLASVDLGNTLDSAFKEIDNLL